MYVKYVEIKVELTCKLFITSLQISVQHYVKNKQTKF